MINVTSANTNQTIYINHRKIELIKPIGTNLHIILDNKNTYIVSDDINTIKSRIIEFESSILNSAITKKTE